MHPSKASNASVKGGNGIFRLYPDKFPLRHIELFHGYCTTYSWCTAILESEPPAMLLDLLIREDSSPIALLLNTLHPAVFKDGKATCLDERTGENGTPLALSHQSSGGHGPAILKQGDPASLHIFFGPHTTSMCVQPMLYHAVAEFKSPAMVLQILFHRKTAPSAIAEGALHTKATIHQGHVLAPE